MRPSGSECHQSNAGRRLRRMLPGARHYETSSSYSSAAEGKRLVRAWYGGAAKDPYYDRRDGEEVKGQGATWEEALRRLFLEVLEKTKHPVGCPACGFAVRGPATSSRSAERKAEASTRSSSTRTRRKGTGRKRRGSR